MRRSLPGIRVAARFAAASAAAGALVALRIGLAGAAEGEPHLARPRDFELSYQVTVREIPPDARELKVWLPVPQTDAHQEILGLRIEAPIAHRFEKEDEYGNLVLALEGEGPLPPDIPIHLEAEVRRYPRVSDPGRRDPSAAPTTPGGRADRRRYLSPDRLVPLGGPIASLAKEVTRGKTTVLEKARAIYDHVTGTMRYDKSGEGWGRGDALRACDVRAGNCSDFHALFIGMCRAAGIPARFEIGFPLPEGEREGVIPGYHCWAEFFVPEVGWVPVDCSEATKNPERMSFYFGSLDPNRVQFTIGRDVRIEGAGAESPLNFFIYPLVEVDGKRHDAVSREVRFADRTS